MRWTVSSRVLSLFFLCRMLRPIPRWSWLWLAKLAMRVWSILLSTMRKLRVAISMLESTMLLIDLCVELFGFFFLFPDHLLFYLVLARWIRQGDPCHHSWSCFYGSRCSSFLWQGGYQSQGNVSISIVIYDDLISTFWTIRRNNWLLSMNPLVFPGTVFWSRLPRRGRVFRLLVNWRGMKTFIVTLPCFLGLDRLLLVLRLALP